jgi:Trypsin-like peptidase domain
VAQRPDVWAEWRDAAGTPVDGMHVVFPLCQLTEDGPRFVATAFFIAQHGLFMTARHAVVEPSTGRVPDTLRALQLFAKGHSLFRRIADIAFDDASDVALGTLQTVLHPEGGRYLANPAVTMSSYPARLGDDVMTFAYPKTSTWQDEKETHIEFEANWYFGQVWEKYRKGRDNVMLPGPCYRTSLEILHGASGGPVFNRFGRVFAVNSTGYEGVQESFVSAIQGARNLAVADTLSRAVPLRKLTFEQFITRGDVHLYGRPSL